MSTTYPATKQTFQVLNAGDTLANAGHTDNHNTLGDTLEALQDVVGTTNGTNVLKDFSAGNFPARVNASNVLQHSLQGTINNSVIGTPSITGGTYNNAVLGTPSITGGTFNSGVFGTPTLNRATAGTPTVIVGSDATGDLYYRSAGGTLTKLGIGSNGQYLTTNGTTPSWGTVASSSSQRDLMSAYLSSDIDSLDNNTPTKITYDTEVFDTNNSFSSGAYVVKAGRGGRYRVKAKAYFYNTIVDQTAYRVMIYLNGASVAEDRRVASGSVHPVMPEIEKMLQLSAGGTIEFYVQSDSGNNTVKVFGNSTMSFCEIEQIDEA